MTVNLKRSTHLQGQVVSKGFIDVQLFKNITFKRTYEVAKMGLEDLIDSLTVSLSMVWDDFYSKAESQTSGSHKHQISASVIGYILLRSMFLVSTKFTL